MQTDLFSSDGEGAGGQIEPTDLYQATRHRYLNYALSVITSRALPDVRDGLEPVQRRILYGMYKDLKLRADTRWREWLTGAGILLFGMALGALLRGSGRKRNSRVRL